MFAWPQPVLETARLQLRATQPSDARRIQELAGAREIADTTLLIPHPYTDGLAEKWIDTLARDWKDARLAGYAIVPRETEVMVGVIALKLDPEYARAELGYWIGVPFWGMGYATEAGRAILRFGFDELRLNRIFAFHFSRNPRSGRVLEKLGFRHEGCLREHVKRWDRFEDLECRAILRRDWSG